MYRIVWMYADTRFSWHLFRNLSNILDLTHMQAAAVKCPMVNAFANTLLLKLGVVDQSLAYDVKLVLQFVKIYFDSIVG